VPRRSARRRKLGQAASQKAKEIADNRRRKRAEKYDATESALELAKDVGVDLDDVDGTGADLYVERLVIRHCWRPSSRRGP
jgi:pyruvate/2-oxoglutarate dehydrogenase complex dihydrolipoamide acyltransferase (E2) component